MWFVDKTLLTVEYWFLSERSTNERSHLSCLIRRISFPNSTDENRERRDFLHVSVRLSDKWSIDSERNVRTNIDTPLCLTHANYALRRATNSLSDDKNDEERWNPSRFSRSSVDDDDDVACHLLLAVLSFSHIRSRIHRSTVNRLKHLRTELKQDKWSVDEINSRFARISVSVFDEMFRWSENSTIIREREKQVRTEERVTSVALLLTIVFLSWKLVS